jgi:hypothetical protein
MAGKSNHRAEKVKTARDKAKPITEAEARYIIAHATASSNRWVVIQHMDLWFDTRSLTRAETADLLDDLDRKWAAELAAGVANPH